MLFNKKTKKLQIQEKFISLENIKKKLNNIKELLNRNKNIIEPIYLNFPFLVIEPSNYSHTNVAIKMQFDLKKLSVCSNNEIKLIGDLELLNMIEINFKQKNNQGLLKKNSFITFQNL